MEQEASKFRCHTKVGVQPNETLPLFLALGFPLGLHVGLSLDGLNSLPVARWFINTTLFQDPGPVHLGRGVIQLP